MEASYRIKNIHHLVGWTLSLGPVQDNLTYIFSKVKSSNWDRTIWLVHQCIDKQSALMFSFNNIAARSGMHFGKISQRASVRFRASTPVSILSWFGLKVKEVEKIGKTVNFIKMGKIGQKNNFQKIVERVRLTCSKCPLAPIPGRFTFVEINWENFQNVRKCRGNQAKTTGLITKGTKFWETREK